MIENTKRSLKLGICVLVTACAACSQKETAAPAAAPTQQAQKSEMNASSTGDILDRQVAGARADLSTRFGIPSGTINVREARVVQWGSGAIGCPKEGMSYTQAIVPGVLVILEADGVSYRYHGRASGELAYCPDDRAREPVFGPGKELK